MDVCKEAKVSVTAFFAGIFSAYIFCCSSLQVSIIPSIFLVVFSITLLRSNSFLSNIVVRAFYLGLAFTFGLNIYFSDSIFHLIGLYLTALSVFHFSEFFVTAVFNNTTLSLDSFILNHSQEYHIAVVLSFSEFFIECWLFPSFKHPGVISLAGFLCMLTGELLRKTAMAQAGTNFNHHVQHQKAADHQLVTTGVYALSRHPSYVGWFAWSVGTQIMLLNPVCLCGFAVASWRFFNDRIEHEEIFLLKFFGEDYCDYQQRVGIGLPFIRGFVVEKDKLQTFRSY